jgi:hypothetical protein
MTLPASQQRVLDQIEKTLAHDHPALDRLFGMFTRLTRQEAMPVTERVAAQPRRMRQRIRPAVAAVVGLAMAIGVLVGISLTLPRPQVCPPGTVSPVAARLQSVSAGRQPACVPQPAIPSTTGQPSPR